MRFHCSLSGLKQAAPLHPAKRLSNDVIGRPYRTTLGTPGAVAVEGPLADSTPLTGRQADSYKYQSG